ncbi:hypothetical protein HD554DRAFT_1801390 [Boletus coccyginus]|nr:hypothetical protein HD554DRAFT_1801390 [Boletus coccyginus]
MVASRRRSSVSDSCRMRYQRTRLYTMSEGNGNATFEDTVSRSWRSWEIPRGTLRSMVRLSGTTRAHCRLIRQTSTIFSLSTAMRLSSWTHHPTEDMRGNMLHYMAWGVMVKHSRHSGRCSQCSSNLPIPKFVGLEITTSMQLPRFNRRSRRLPATCRACSLTPLTGRLYDKTQQAAAFEELPVYDELRSSMTTRLDCARIRREVKKFYRYVMFSHRWQPNEPTFQQVEKMSVYKLPASPAFSKLQNFCKLVHTLCFEWAWSDTCCVNQLDKGVQQESMVAMFRWYRGSSLTVVHLLGVFSQSQKKGCLWRSIWNTRGWTYQEYVASQVVQFYTEDWKPYLGLDIFNHKESPIILSEMEQAMNLATQELATLQPGLERTREKLYLASRRETTREEDMAYSLFGIFNIAIPVIYGEGTQAVGRLLEYILTRSDNVILLAWTGRCSSSQHSYLPTDLTVYNEIVPPHVPSPMETAEMDGMVTTLRSSLPDLSVTIALYERLYHLPPLSLVAGRLRLPGIVFPLADVPPILESDLDSDLPVYRATSPMLGNVEIKTTAELSGKEGLLLVHPWISPVLDQEFSCGASRFDHTTCALRLLVRLRQPFGALLLAPLGRVQYRRVATDSLIMVRIREETSSTELTNSIRTIDIQ